MFNYCFFISKKGEDVSDAEDGEEKEEGGIHPLVTLTNINPEDIPDIPVNKFLLRGDPRNDSDKKDKRKGNNVQSNQLFVCLFFL